SKAHSISVPSGVTEMRVMVYWMDNEAAPNAARALVNNLDINLQSPGGATTLPLVLDHTPDPTTLNFPAVPGVDSLNNVEQVRLYNPSAGNYTLNVTGTDVPFGNRSYWVVYEFHTDEISLTYPYGGEGFVPGETQRLHWDAQPISGNFTLEYTLDDGANWLPITTVPGNVRMYDWTVPTAITDQARVRISRGGLTSESAYNFTIIDVPQGLSVNYICNNLVSVSWDSLPGAAEYQVYLLGEKYMDSMGRTTDTTLCFPVNNISGEQWFSISAVPSVGGNTGRRSFATNYNGPINSCGGSVNISVFDLISPVGSDISLCFGDSTTFTFTVFNTGQTIATGFLYGYQIDNTPAVSQTYSGNLAPCEIDQVSINAQIGSLGTGLHSVKVWSNLAGDLDQSNDTLTFDVYIVGFPYT
ncbi:MAG: peptidase S8, partial [Bacteroidota bacterium]